MIHPSVAARTALSAGRPDDRASTRARSIVADLSALEPGVRRGLFSGLPPREFAAVLAASEQMLGTPWGLYADDPVGFIEDVLGEAVWSRPRQFLGALATDTKVAVPSAFGTSKTWSASRAALWFSYTRPVGVAKVVTIAPRWRQVARQLWPELRAGHKAGDLPGRCDLTQLKLRRKDGLETVVAYGLSAPPHQEDAVQGIHAASLLVIVEEAGGIARTIGRNLAAMMTGDARMVAIGNPPTDDEGSWFESFCEDPTVTTIPISAYDTPNLTGEAAPRCRSCPAESPPHSLAAHLVDRGWVEEAVREHGEDSPYVQAKVYARFPRGGASRVLPTSWIEEASTSDEPDLLGPDAGQYVALDALGLAGETEGWLVRRGAWVRLGVDVAADGGDEFVISRAVGDLVEERYAMAGPDNENSVHVAGKVLEHIREAEALAAALGTRVPVRVKVDTIGVGWGIVGTLRAWGDEGLHTAEIVAVNVSEGTYRDADEATTLRPSRKRDEMWLAMRSLLQPRPGFPPQVRLRLPERTLAQMRGPKYGTSATGLTVVESKKAMKARGMKSPDRAEAALMAVYEPVIRDAAGTEGALLN